MEDIKKEDTQHNDALVQPEPETLHSTDPQDNMKGPVSSIMQGMNENEEENSKEDEAIAKKAAEEKE